MPTFRSKEIVDARQFVGGIDNAKELVAWFREHVADYRSSTLNVSESRIALGSADPQVEIPAPHLTIFCGDDPTTWWSLGLEPTDWLVRKQSGRVVVRSDERMKKEYDQV